MEDGKLGNSKKGRAETTGQKIRTLQGQEQRADSLVKAAGSRNLLAFQKKRYWTRKLMRLTV